MCDAAGEPGSKPFPEFVPLKPAEAVTAASPTLQLAAAAEVRQDGGAKRKPEKISPVKRTRFRARDSRKIVLKRRKVKRLRARPRPAPAPAPAMNPTYREMDIRDRPRAERDRRHPDTGTASDQVGYSSIKSSYEIRGDADP